MSYLIHIYTTFISHQILFFAQCRLPELNARYNWAKQEIPLKEKDVVLIPEGNIPKGKEVRKPFTGKMKEFV